MLELIDSHCHLDFPVFDVDRSELLSRCSAAGIKQFIVPGVEADSWQKLVAFAQQFTSIHIAFGLHPYFIEKHRDKDLDSLITFCKTYNPVAIGEIGLDFYRQDLAKEKQLQFFEKQLLLAEQLSLPVILHVRKAHQQVLQLLKRYRVPGGVAHAFNGSIEQAEQYMKLDFKLGFGGALTYQNASKLKKLASTLPLDSIVLETDSPDMCPADYPSQRNTPMTLLAVLKEMENLRQVSQEVLALQFSRNTQEVFRL